MIIKTKKYQLATKDYVKLGLMNVLREQWWVGLIAVAIASLTFFYPDTIWFIIIAVVALLLYLLFWVVQFYGVTQLPQNKVMFERMNYEIDSRQVLMKLNAKQGMPLTWDNFKKGTKGKDHFLLVISKAQMIHLPFRIFNSQNDLRFMEALLRRKGFLEEKPAEKEPLKGRKA